MGGICCKDKLTEESYIPPEPNELYHNYIPCDNYAKHLGRKTEQKRYTYVYNGREWEGVMIEDEGETGARLGKYY